jgi:hypothetical protein
MAISQWYGCPSVATGPYSGSLTTRVKGEATQG